MEKATFAGGCFWCMVTPFEEQPGIESIVSGYTGGHVDDPTYEQVKTGTTGHYEVVEIIFDPTLFAYERLLELYWIQTDPTDDGGQFQDRGSQYAPAIFYHTEEQ
ncbi:MAG: peptide-methionine (S)-S-oxide reductase MsrA, partial [Exiguobacterium chiriqhucha]|uniref:peptide-methionine (S)-S-oxide reductase MsrA n=1 Tax=Exiguobacterium chiriqhucha TaxID=1385984 RepID=UPI00144C5595